MSRFLSLGHSLRHMFTIVLKFMFFLYLVISFFHHQSAQDTSELPVVTSSIHIHSPLSNSLFALYCQINNKGQKFTIIEYYLFPCSVSLYSIGSILFFSLWLISLNMMPSVSIQVSKNSMTSSLLCFTWVLSCIETINFLSVHLAKASRFKEKN